MLMKNYKGWWFSLVTAGTLFAQDQPSIVLPESATPASEAQASRDVMLEHEKKLVAEAMTGGAPSKTSEPTARTEPIREEKAPSSFASAHKLFNEMWGIQEETEGDTTASKPTPRARPASPLPATETHPVITPAKVTSTPPPSHSIPFPQEKGFAENPVGGMETKLPPMPDTLLPMGKPKLVGVSPKTPPKPVEVASNEIKPPVAPTPPPAVVTEPAEEPQITVSPFIDWVRENKNAADLGREALEKYRADSTKKDSTTAADDVFLRIRFPYVGSQASPPNSSAVIYTTPKK